MQLECERGLRCDWNSNVSAYAIWMQTRLFYYRMHERQPPWQTITERMGTAYATVIENMAAACPWLNSGVPSIQL